MNDYLQQEVRLLKNAIAQVDVNNVTHLQVKQWEEQLNALSSRIERHQIEENVLRETNILVNSEKLIEKYVYDSVDTMDLDSLIEYAEMKMAEELTSILKDDPEHLIDMITDYYDVDSIAEVNLDDIKVH